MLAEIESTRTIIAVAVIRHGCEKPTMRVPTKLLLLSVLFPFLGSVQASTGAPAVPEYRSTAIVNVGDYGVTVGAFRAAVNELASRGGGVLEVPAGTYGFDSSDLSQPIMLSSNMEVRGNGARITVLGGAVTASVFAAHDASNILISNLDVTGNSRALANSASGAFFQYTLTDNARVSASGISLSHIRLDNFAAERWISFINANAAARAITDIVAENVSIVSRRGNSIAPDRIAIWSHGIVLMGEKGAIAGVRITDFAADAAYIKSGIGILKNVSDVRIERAVIRSAGLHGAVDDAGGYAVALYGGPGEVSNVTVSDTLIANPRSAGIYAVGAENVSVVRSKISGQSDSHLGTLPKGALAFNGARNVKVSGCYLSDNNIDMEIVARASDNRDIGADIDALQATGARLASIILNPGVGDGPVGGVKIRNSRLEAAGRALQVLNGISVGRVITSLTIENATLSSSATNAIELSPFQTARISGYVFRNVHIAAKGIAIAAQNLSGDISMTGVDVTGLGPDSVGFLFGKNLKPGIWSGVRTKHIDQSRIAPARVFAQSGDFRSAFTNIRSMQ